MKQKFSRRLVNVAAGGLAGVGLYLGGSLATGALNSASHEAALVTGTTAIFYAPFVGYYAYRAARNYSPAAKIEKPKAKVAEKSARSDAPKIISRRAPPNDAPQIMQEARPRDPDISLSGIGNYLSKATERYVEQERQRWKMPHVEPEDAKNIRRRSARYFTQPIATTGWKPWVGAMGGGIGGAILGYYLGIAAMTSAITSAIQSGNYESVYQALSFPIYGLIGGSLFGAFVGGSAGNNSYHNDLRRAGIESDMYPAEPPPAMLADVERTMSAEEKIKKIELDIAEASAKLEQLKKSGGS